MIVVMVVVGRVVVVVVVRVVMFLFLVVVVVVVVVTGLPDTLRRPVVVLLDASAELQPDAAEVHFFVGEGGEGGLVGPRHQRLGAHRLEVAQLGPGPEPARQPVGLLLIDVGPHDVAPVREPGADALDAFLHLQFVVVPVDDVQRDAHALDDAVAQIAQAEVDAPDAAA